jgi:glyoxylase-like metal-dependent hydrolase (beta-lactamase superfamily II)
VSDQIYFRQWLAGRDFAVGEPLARSMLNLVYAIGDPASGEALLVDPAYAPAELIDLLAADGFRLSGVLATHYHFDHVGGRAMGAHVAGLAELAEVADVPVHVQAAEAPWVARAAGVSEGDLVTHSGGDVVRVGSVEVTLIHTPGHTPGSQCLLVDGHLVTGDTLFLEGCGRTDLPGGDPDELYTSLTERLASVPDDAVLYPGHLYADRSAPLGDVRLHNFVLAPTTRAQWLTMFGS